jgi:hypothetical protein
MTLREELYRLFVLGLGTLVRPSFWRLVYEEPAMGAQIGLMQILIFLHDLVILAACPKKVRHELWS